MDIQDHNDKKEFNYKRENGDYCQLFELVKKNVKYYPGISYGDIVYEVNGYRALNSYIYCNEGFVGLSSMGPGNGSGGITKNITKYIENPLTFFSMDAIYAGDIAEIELDSEAHYQMLKKKAGNRDFSKSIDFIISYYGGSPLVTFESAKLLNGDYHELELTSKLDSIYLENKPFTEIDPITLKNINKKMLKYEKNASKVLKIGNSVSYKLLDSNSQGGGFIEIIDIKYDNDNNNDNDNNDNLKPIEIICEDKYNLGIANITQTIFTFNPIMNPDELTPTWTCIDLKSKYSKLTLSDYNFSK